MTSTTIPADEVVEFLVSEGYDRADVLATIDSPRASAPDAPTLGAYLASAVATPY